MRPTIALAVALALTATPTYTADPSAEQRTIAQAVEDATQRLDAAAASQAAAEQRHAARVAAWEPSVQQMAEAIADGLPYDWRAAGLRIVEGCHPRTARCHWGTYDHDARTAWIAPAAAENHQRLRYVVTHEVAHHWQATTGHRGARAGLPGRTGTDATERAADCLAAEWGAPHGVYWTCPPEARRAVADLWRATP